jgi:hypothetical protein
MTCESCGPESWLTYTRARRIRFGLWGTNKHTIKCTNVELWAILQTDQGPWPWKPRANSHTRLKALDHGNVRDLTGRKGGDRPSLLHTTRWRHKGLEKSLWMKNLHGVLHGGLWIRVHGLPEFASSPPPWSGYGKNSRRPCTILIFFSSMTDCRAYFMIDSKTDNTTKYFS